MAANDTPTTAGPVVFSTAAPVVNRLTLA